MDKATSHIAQTPYSDLMAFLKNKQFELANMGVSYKNAYDWRNAGLYLQDKQRRYRMKYSPIEYVWLLLIKEIREFGLSFDAIKNVKDFLMMPVDVSALLVTLQETDSHSDIIDAELEKLGVMKGTAQEIEGVVEKLGEHIVDSVFMSMLLSTFMGENTYYLRITKEGNCTFESDDDLLLPVINESHLTIPLTNLIKDFLKKEQIDTYDLERDKNKIIQEFELDDVLNRKPSAQLQNEIDQLLKDLEANHIQYTSRDGKKINISYDSKEA